MDDTRSLELEKEVEKHLIKGAEECGLLCVKFIPDQMSGMPDRLLLLPDQRCIWVELKRHSGKLSPIQEYRHKQLRRLGQRVEVVWSKEEADALIRGIREEATR